MPSEVNDEEGSSTYREAIEAAFAEWQSKLSAPPTLPLSDADLTSLSKLIARKLDAAGLAEPDAS